MQQGHEGERMELAGVGRELHQSPPRPLSHTDDAAAHNHAAHGPDGLEENLLPRSGLKVRLLMMLLFLH